MNKAVILEIRNSYIVVLDDEGAFIKLCKKDQAVVGEEIYYTSADIHRKKSIIKYLPMVAVVFLVLGITLFQNQLIPFSLLGTNSYEELMVVSVDVNPSVEFLIDTDYKVREIRPLNDDAKGLIKNSWIKKPYAEVIEDYIDRLNDEGYLQKNKAILFGYSLLKEETEENGIEIEQISNLNQEKIRRRMGEAYSQLDIMVDKSTYLRSRDNDISIGRYQTRIKNQETNKERVSDIIYRIEKEEQTDGVFNPMQRKRTMQVIDNQEEDIEQNDELIRNRKNDDLEEREQQEPTDIDQQEEKNQNNEEGVEPKKNEVIKDNRDNNWKNNNTGKN